MLSSQFTIIEDETKTLSLDKEYSTGVVEIAMYTGYPSGWTGTKIPDVSYNTNADSNIISISFEHVGDPAINTSITMSAEFLGVVSS